MKGTVLVIEDNQENQYLARFLLESNGYTVKCAASGKEALELVQSVRPQVVLLDISLSDMDGCAVAAALRQMAGFEDTPILAFTAHAMAGDRERFIAAGCTGYIEKPITPETFVKDIEKQLQSGSLRTESESHSRTVLVVDDIEENRYQLQVLLNSKGFEVVHAANGAEALQKARERKPDLIISDILMPVMDGFSLCRAWRRDPDLQSVPFIFYTATYTDPKDEELAMRAGADRFVVKPLETEAFLRIIDAIISRGVRRCRSEPPMEQTETTVSITNDNAYLQQYNQALIRKLEDKLVQLDAARRQLETEIAHSRNVEAALRESEQHLRDIYERMPVGYQSLDSQGRLLDVNPSWLEMFGYSRDEVIGRPLADFLTPQSKAKFQQRFPVFRDQEGRTRSELEFQCKNGQVKIVSIQGVFIREQNGRPRQSHCILNDITESRWIESAHDALLALGKGLGEATSRVDVARHLFAAADRIWRWDAGTLDVVNVDAQFHETVLGIDTIDGQRREVRVEQSSAGFPPLLKQVIDEGPVLLQRAPGQMDHGNLIPFGDTGRISESIMAVPIKYRDKLVGVFSLQSYISEAFDEKDLKMLESLANHCAGALQRVQTTEQLHESQTRLLLAIEATGLGIWDWDLTTGRIVWEGHHARLFGFKPDEFDGTYECFEKRVHPEDRAKIAEAVRQARDNRTTYECEYRVVWPDGSVHWIAGHGRFSYDAAGRPVRMVGVVRETTEKRLAEEQLRESERRFRSLYNNTVLGLYRTTPDGQILMANPALVKMLGYDSFDELARLNLENGGFHPQYPRKLFRDAIERDGFVRGLESAWIRKDGSPVYVRESAQAVRDEQGNILYYDGTVEDITEYRQVQMQMERQAALLEAATDAIHVRSMDRVVAYWNAASERTFGWTRQEAVGRKITEIGVKDVASFDAAEKALLEKGIWSGELKFETKSGKTLTMFCRWTVLPQKQSDRGTEILAIQTDITEKNELEARFLRAQRLEGIGALASGIAHDLNNVLSPIVMGVSLLRDKCDAPEFQASIEMIASSAQRGASIVRQLLTFARGVKGERIPIQLQHLIRDTGRLIRETFPRNVTYYELCPRDLWTVIGDPTQIQQVLLNLCVNARDAMPAGGDLRVTAANKTLDKQFLATVAPDVREGPFVLIEVTDTGHGMTPDVMEHLFEPFFTTKETGAGTGLGLATSLGIVKSHGGFVQVKSTPGQGSVFSVFLPAEPDALCQPSREQPVAPQGHGELVLVVDDEVGVREVTRRTLEKHGYRVLVAEDGAAAISVYTEYRERIDVVLTDLLMPVMDGVGLATALRRIDPKLPIIVSTGDPASPNQQAKLAQLNKLGVTVSLLKPYGSADLLRTLSSVLRPK